VTRHRLLDMTDSAHGHGQMDLIEVHTFADAADALHGLPDDLGPFALLLLGDATGVFVDVVVGIAEAGLERRLFWLSAWGPDCERVHDVFDEVAVGEGDSAPGADELMATWHDDEPWLRPWRSSGTATLVRGPSARPAHAGRRSGGSRVR
jgi:hypothetical protein